MSFYDGHLHYAIQEQLRVHVICSGVDIWEGVALGDLELDCKGWTMRGLGPASCCLFWPPKDCPVPQRLMGGGVKLHLPAMGAHAPSVVWT